MSKMFCTKCGKQLTENEKHCPFCREEIVKGEMNEKISLNISVSKERPWGAIGMSITGVFLWLLILILVPSGEYDARMYWKSDKPWLFLILGCAAVISAYQMLKKYRKSHVLDESGKGWYRVLQVSSWAFRIIGCLFVVAVIVVFFFACGKG